MAFHSVLFQESDDWLRTDQAEPAFFRDLNLDQFVDAITASKQAYDLRPFYYTPLPTVAAIGYRQEVLKDLEDKAAVQHINRFAHGLRSMHEHLEQSKKLSYKHQKQTWFLDAIARYCDAVSCLADGLAATDLESPGLSGFRDYLLDYIESNSFVSLQSETEKLKADLSAIEYCVLINGDTFRVRKYESESDYTDEIEETFKKFRQGSAEDHRLQFPESVQMNHVEATIDESVSLLFPEIFSRLIAEKYRLIYQQLKDRIKS